MASSFDPHRFGFAPSQAARSQWRDMNESGFITGLPMIAGKAIATNGVLVVIERAHDFIIGHITNWQKFEVERKVKPRKPVVETIVFE